MKTCKTCNEEKAFDCYSKHTKARDGLSSICRVCNTERLRIRRTENPQMYRDAKRLYLYNLLPGQWQHLVNLQNNCCGICKTPFTDTVIPQLDHDHDTGTIRGLLCNHCNRGLGGLDTVAKITNAIKYLERHV